MSGEARTRLMLVRAVRPDELASIRSLKRFTNIAGVERKYFTTTLASAHLFAEMAQARYQDGPYRLVMTSIDPALLPPDCRVTVERGIVTIKLPTDLLYTLAQPQILVD